MDNRKYNIIFHLHTVSGIVLSILIYIIFFTGSFSFFRDEIVNWERIETAKSDDLSSINIDQLTKRINDSIPLRGRNIELYKYYKEERIVVNISPSKDSLSPQHSTPYFFYILPNTFETFSYENSYTLGEFLYRLHFLAQLPRPFGGYISGLTAFFLLFILLTGILIHWKKIISNFFLFRPMSKTRIVWSDLHTILGTVGLPFQFIYALTGAFFMLKALLIAPSILFLYNGNEKQLYDDLEFSDPSFIYKGEHLNTFTPTNKLINKTLDKWTDFNMTNIFISNFGDSSMHTTLEGYTPHKTRVNGLGKITYISHSGNTLNETSPYQGTSYLTSVKNLLNKIHFGDYGGLPLRIISFLLGISSCFVVLSGIMIWIESRKKQKLSEHKKRINAWVGHIYLATCLSLLPVTALSFILTRLLSPESPEYRMDFLYYSYFITWILASIFLSVKKDDFFTNKLTLITGGLIGLFIPILDIIILGARVIFLKPDIIIIDLLWLTIGLTCTWIGLQLKRK